MGYSSEVRAIAMNPRLRPAERRRLTDRARVIAVSTYLNENAPVTVNLTIDDAAWTVVFDTVTPAGGALIDGLVTIAQFGEEGVPTMRRYIAPPPLVRERDDPSLEEDVPRALTRVAEMFILTGCR